MRGHGLALALFPRLAEPRYILSTESVTTQQGQVAESALLARVAHGSGLSQGKQEAEHPYVDECECLSLEESVLVDGLRAAHRQETAAANRQYCIPITVANAPISLRYGRQGTEESVRM